MTVLGYDEAMDTHDDVLVRGAADLGFALTAEQRALFRRYQALLIEENPLAGITAVVEPEEVQRRHFLESIAVAPALTSLGLPLPKDGRLADVGSGGGFPGLPLAIVLPLLRATLIESHGRRSAFLERLVAALGMESRVDVVHARAEEAGRRPELREGHNIVVSRAVAPLRVLAELALPLLREGGILAAVKGSRARDEIAEAGPALAELGGGEPQVVPIAVAGAGVRPVLVVVQKVATTPQRYPRRVGVPKRRPLS